MPLEYFPCFDSYAEKTRSLSDQELGRLFRALMRYHATGEPQQLAGRESMAYDFIADDIDRANRAYSEKCSKAKKSVEKRYANPTIEYERIPSNTNVYESYQTKDKTKDKTNDISNDISTPAKHKYGECDNVLLTDDELEKLKQKFPSDWQAKIDNLSVGIAMKGYKYKSHYLAICQWAKKDAERPPQSFRPEKPGDIKGCSGLGEAELEAIRQRLAEPMD